MDQKVAYIHMHPVKDRFVYQPEHGKWRGAIDDES